MKQWLFLLLMLSLPALAKAQALSSDDYKIYSVEAQRTISLAELVAAVEDTDVLFFGEEHTDGIGHRLQDTLYRLLLDRYGEVTLSMEMFETDCRQVVDEYLSGYITEDKFMQDARAWKNYKEHYRPMVETAKARTQPVVAANAPRRYVNIVSRKGLDSLYLLPKSAQAYLPPFPIYTADTAYYRRFSDIMNGAGHALKDDKIFHAQCTWDAGMAYSIYQHLRKHRPELIYHLNGRFHTDYRQGTITQLRRLSKKIDIRNISCFPAADFDRPDWAAYSELGDFVILSREPAKE